jgi:hypothetical protein
MPAPARHRLSGRFAGDDAMAFHHADGKAGKVVFAGPGINIRHFRRFASDEGAVGHPTAFGNAFHNRRHDFRIQFVNPHIIQKEQRFGALNQHIIDIHRHQVLSDSLVPVHFLGNENLGPHAIGAGNQYGTFIIPFEQFFVIVQTKQSRKAIFQADNTRPVRGCNRPADAFDHNIIRVDTDARLFIRDRFFLSH